MKEARLTMCSLMIHLGIRYNFATENIPNIIPIYIHAPSSLLAKSQESCPKQVWIYQECHDDELEHEHVQLFISIMLFCNILLLTQ
ncbi:hypothetical protein L6164_029939 [Bauhinia variegata]|uniref:Uncharacterized protein n=1 Tax=Bauhinia variegata TaxID=167791 RepID=A0ACB9LAR4_BAUVA|nr:hypothetical protein L6164_029939 [Bauhinia variegata]